MEQERTLMDWMIYGNAVTDWLQALGISAVIVLAVYLLKPIVIRRMQSWSDHTRTGVDDAVVTALQATKLWLVVVFALSLGAQSLELSERVAATLRGAATVAMFVQLGFWLSALLKFWIGRSRQRAMAANAAAATSLAAIGFIGQVAMWSILLLVALDNLGINVTALVAGLGVGGVAVALAVQNILGDLFASLSIVIDKPFVIGDFIIVDDYMGTVENIGLKTTRVRSLGGELLVFSNSDLLKARLRNYKRMYERRVEWGFGLVQSTPLEQLEQVPELVKRIITAQQKVRFERAHFYRFGDSSFDIQIVYWVLDPDFNLYMDIQQAINLALVREFQARDLHFAYPTRTLRVEEPLRLATEGGGGERRTNGQGQAERAAAPRAQ